MGRSIGNTFNVSKDQNSLGIERRQFHPYPRYKDSGVEWLGKIPENWKVRPLKYIAPLITDRIDGIAVEIPYIGLEHLESLTGKMVSAAGYGSSEGQEAEGLYTCFRSGDVLFGKLRPYLAKVLLSSFDGRCSSELLVFRSGGEISPSFLAYQLLSPGFIAWINAMTYGTKMPRASPDQVMSIPIAIPDADEQRAISAFLERETAKIDALIEKKERLIELLQEKRTALITQAVTKGLVPTVPMKDSGVEWLGEIPTHWAIESNKRLFEDSDIRSDYGDEELLTVSHLSGVTRRSEKNVTMIEAESLEDYKICSAGELAINTMWAWMGALGISKESGIVSPSYNVYVLRTSSLDPRYYDYLCRTPLHVAELTRYSKGIWKSRLRLYPDGFFEISTPIPPIKEQQRIADQLDNAVSKIDALLMTIRRAAGCLKEYRTALISFAVTGKIDIRNITNGVSR